MILTLLIGLAAAAAKAPPPSGIDLHPPLTCDGYIGRTVSPASFDTVAARLAKLPRAKGEYETTAAFDARVAAAATDEAVIVATPLDLSHVRYDADAAALTISIYAIRNLGVTYDEVFGHGTPYDGQVTFDPRGNADLVVSEHEVQTGSYVGSNDLGARARITKITRTTKAIFDYASGPLTSDVFRTEQDNLLGMLPMAPAEARALKPRLSAAVVIAPKWPFYATGTKQWGNITVESPEDITQHIAVIVANFRCALILDGRKVIAAYQTL